MIALASTSFTNASTIMMHHHHHHQHHPNQHPFALPIPPPPPSKPVFQSAKDKDNEAEALLGRIGQVAAAWCSQLKQLQPATVEHERVLKFCHRILEQMVMPKADSKNDSTPSFIPPPLPLWNHLPGSVLSLDYYRNQLARRIQYRETALFLAQRLTAGNSAEAESYIQVCEAQAKLALEIAATGQPPIVPPVAPNNFRPQQQPPMMDEERVCRSPKTVIPPPSPVIKLPKSSVAPSIAKTVPTAKPAASQKKEDDDSLSAPELLSSLFHASRCPTDPKKGGEPCFFEHCSAYKTLWHHLTSPSNKDASCNGNCSLPHCDAAKRALRHFRKCKHPQCGVCGPVVAVLPKLKSDLARVQRIGDWTALPPQADGAKPDIQPSPLMRRSALRRPNSSKGPLKKRHRVKFGKDSVGSQAV